MSSTIPTVQTALIVTELGKPLQVTHNWPVPKPSPTQVLVKIVTAGLNPHDAKSRDVGLFIADDLPSVLSNDAAGTVVAVGSSVKNFKVGDRVLTQPNFHPGSLQNALRQYAVFDSQFTIKIPEKFSFDDAATLPTNLIAPLFGIFDDITLGIPAPWTEEAKTFDYKGTTLLIIGGGSNCGRFAVQLAGLAGIGRVVVVGGTEEQLKPWGATHVLSRHGGDEEVLKRIRSVVGDDLIYAFDAVNPPLAQVLALKALSSTKKGRISRLLPYDIPEASLKEVEKEKKAGFEVKDTMGLSHLRPALAEPFWKNLESYMIEGKIVPLQYEVAKGLDADKVNQLLDLYRDGKPISKTHIHVAE